MRPEAARGAATHEIPRILGSYRGEKPGPTVLVVACMHGNEPSGMQAFRRVLAHLEELRPNMRGEVVGLVGNRGALEQNRRHLSTDFNRLWTRQQVDDLRAGRISPDKSPEHREQVEMLEAMDEICARRRGTLYCLDVHTFSAPGKPFACLSDTLRNRNFAFSFPIPVILGLEEALDGTLLEFMNSEGHIALAFEAGQHDDPLSVENHEAAIWLSLVSAGCLPKSSVPQHARHLARLREAGRGLPHIMEIRYRHAISEADRFRMRPGYSNFQPIVKGEPLADDARGEVRAREAGMILMPLYQPLGNDGFFLGREVRAFWLRVSALIRHARLDAFVHLLPGVSRHPDWEGALLVDPQIARWYVMEIFHLLGFRRERPVGDFLVVSRRLYDFEPRGLH